MNKFEINNGNKITSGFTTPEGYFDNFSLELNKKLNLPKTESNVISINMKWRITSVAALLIITLSVTIYSKIAVGKTDANTMENYITNHSEISQYDLITLLEKKDIENLSVELKLNNTKIDKEFINIIEIDDYLIE